MTEPNVTTRIVVGVDFEETSDHALVTAIRLARRLPYCELHPVHVLPERQGKEKLDELDDLIEKGYTVLRERAQFAASRLFGDEEWEQHTVLHIRVGPPARSIHQVAVDMEADLIVVGHHDRGPLGRLVLGSVAEELVRKAKVPVLVAREKDLEAQGKTDWPEPRREGESLEGGRSWSRTEKLVFGPRPSRVSGLL